MKQKDTTRADVDELKLARAMTLVLPVLSIGGALVAGAMGGIALGILVLAAGVLLGVIALFWASLRVLSGDAPLTPELEALEASRQTTDVLGSRRKMLLRALKDLDNEKSLGKLDDEDYAQISATYRDDLKDVLKRIDASLAPHREKAEALVKAHLEKAGIEKNSPAPKSEERAVDGDNDETDVPEESSERPSRVTCGACEASNETDAKFCKGCGASLGAASKAEPAEVVAIKESGQ
ncbi:hypothetical protein AKJ09_03447 [Labilithrix luteola]|uniref:Zinc-ribbon domain-containing protein n=1 Tax=Labilithrix luteola TaxID=1391654 RepID=A0A0K1PTC2_9BACT|nr:hypothetical protein AKJ09_03447 [Labilithrix luteola]